MKNMMDYADGMEDEGLKSKSPKAVGIGSEEYMAGMDPAKSSQSDSGGSGGGSGGEKKEGGMDMSGIMSMFSKFMGK
jgi:hypothetical protein